MSFTRTAVFSVLRIGESVGPADGVATGSCDESGDEPGSGVISGDAVSLGDGVATGLVLGVGDTSAMPLGEALAVGLGEALAVGLGEALAVGLGEALGLGLPPPSARILIGNDVTLNAGPRLFAAPCAAFGASCGWSCPVPHDVTTTANCVAAPAEGFWGVTSKAHPDALPTLLISASTNPTTG